MEGNRRRKLFQGTDSADEDRPTGWMVETLTMSITALRRSVVGANRQKDLLHSARWVQATTCKGWNSALNYSKVRLLLSIYALCSVWINMLEMGWIWDKYSSRVHVQQIGFPRNDILNIILNEILFPTRMLECSITSEKPLCLWCLFQDWYLQRSVLWNLWYTYITARTTSRNCVEHFIDID